MPRRVSTTATNAPSVRLLSEAALLASDPGDYMNEAQFAFFRARLRDTKAALQLNANDTTDRLKESSAPSDPADRATLEEEYTLELHTRDRERKLLVKIEAALQRIDEGTYGYCQETGEPIGLRRLLARPTATLSIEAQERRERSQRGFAD